MYKQVVNMVVCPFDAAHRIPGTSLEKHLEACMWRAEGYGKEDVPLSIPSLSPENPSCIQFGKLNPKLVIEVVEPFKLR